VHDNLVASSDSLVGNAIYTNNRSRVTAIAVFEINATTCLVAFGDEKGKMTILRFEEGVFTLDKEHFCLAGAINHLIWSADGKVCIALGDGAMALNPDNGSTVGSILGATGKILCGALTPEGVLFSAGEGK